MLLEMSKIEATLFELVYRHVNFAFGVNVPVKVELPC